MGGHLTAAWGLAGVLAVLGLITAPLERSVYRSDPGSRRKLMAYAVTMAVLWTLALAAIGISGGADLFAGPASSAAAWLPLARIAAPMLAVVTAVYCVIALAPLLQSLRGSKWRAAYAAAIRRGFSAFPGLLPNTGAERAVFVLLSLSAGVCEEVLYRGFLIRLLHAGGFALPLMAALAISSLIFGLGHAYQGWRGMLGTATGGLFLGLVFLLCGSLIPAVVLHSLMDMQVAYVLRPVAFANSTTPEPGGTPNP